MTTKQVVFIDPSLPDYPTLAAAIRPDAVVQLNLIPNVRAHWSQYHSAPRQFGTIRGQVQVTDAFFDPLPEEELYTLAELLDGLDDNEPLPIDEAWEQAPSTGNEIP